MRLNGILSQMPPLAQDCTRGDRTWGQAAWQTLGLNNRSRQVWIYIGKAIGWIEVTMTRNRDGKLKASGTSNVASDLKFEGRWQTGTTTKKRRCWTPYDNTSTVNLAGALSSTGGGMKIMDENGNIVCVLVKYNSKKTLNDIANKDDSSVCQFREILLDKRDDAEAGDDLPNDDASDDLEFTDDEGSPHQYGFLDE